MNSDVLRPDDNHEFADVVTSSSDYASRFAGDSGAWMLSVQERLLLELIRETIDRPLSDLSILDVGGGHGQIAAPLVRAGAHVTVVGSTPECAERVAHLERSGRFKFEVGALSQLPFADRSFDVVTCFRFLPHSETWHYTVAELCRTARRHVIFDYPTWQSVNFFSPLLFELKKLIEGNTRTYTLFGHKEMQIEFSRHGFRLAGRRGEFTFPMVLHRFLSDRRFSAWLEGMAEKLGVSEYLGSPAIAVMSRQS